jgi:hypothetical protein
MVGNSSPNVGEGSTYPPPMGRATYPAYQVRRLGARQGMVVAALFLAAVSTAVAVIALVVVLNRPTAAEEPATSGAPTYDHAQTVAAQRKLCDAYKLAAQEVRIETNGNDRALARIALTNAAAMLDDSASDPALEKNQRDAARALASAYRKTTALGSVGTDTEYRTSLEDIIAKDAPMRQACP